MNIYELTPGRIYEGPNLQWRKILAHKDGMITYEVVAESIGPRNRTRLGTVNTVQAATLRDWADREVE
jgi:hypothetical protein